MANLRNLPRDLQPIIDRMITRVDILGNQLENGEISREKWSEEIETLITNFRQSGEIHNVDIADIIRVQRGIKGWMRNAQLNRIIKDTKNG